ncbi:hypothetical protein AALA79_01150 [Lachnospiraceae bacterium 64-25]
MLGIDSILQRQKGRKKYYEPIIDQETFDNVQRIRGQTNRR